MARHHDYVDLSLNPTFGHEDYPTQTTIPGYNTLPVKLETDTDSGQHQQVKSFSLGRVSQVRHAACKLHVRCACIQP